MTEKKYEYILAYADKIPANFQDGGLVTITLLEDLNTKIRFAAKGQSLSVPGWQIDGRIQVDLGFGHDVTVYGIDEQKGLDIDRLKRSKKSNVLLKNVVLDEGR